METEIDFMLVQHSWHKKISNVNMIPGKLQHSLVVMDVNKLGRRKIKQPSKKHIKIWKLENEEVKDKFAERMNALYEKSDEQDVWCKYRDSACKAAEVCGVSRGRPHHGEIWWWNQEVQDVITKEGVLESGKSNHLMRTGHVITEIRKRPRKL